MEAFGAAGVRQNCLQEWLVITDYSGVGFPEFSLRCLEDLGYFFRGTGAVQNQRTVDSMSR